MIVTRIHTKGRTINVRADVDSKQVEVRLTEPVNNDSQFWTRATIRMTENEAILFALHLDKYAEVDVIKSFGGPLHQLGPVEPRVTCHLGLDTPLKLQFMNESNHREHVELLAHHVLNLSANIKACIGRLKEERDAELERLTKIHAAAAADLERRMQPYRPVDDAEFEE